MKTNKKDWVIGVGICVLILLAVFPVTVLGVPGVINYQGYLTDAGGNPLNGDVTILFQIWDAEVAGTKLWTESHAAVAVSEGVFNVLLGSSVPIGPSILEREIESGILEDRWLEIAVGPTGGTPELMTPRTKMTSVAYAIIAGYADSVAAGSVNASALSNTAVTEAKIASGAVTSGKLGSGSVTSDKVASGAVSSDKIASEAVTGAKVAAGTLTASHLQDGAALTEILDDDGAGSGLDADLLDGQHASAFSLAGHNHDGAYVNVSGDSMSGASNQPILSVTNTGTGQGISSSCWNKALVGSANGIEGTGVFGTASGSGGEGVWGAASGEDGAGVRGMASNDGYVTNYGGLFGAAGRYGRGVLGSAGGADGYGVMGSASGYNGRGVYGTATSTGYSDVNYGGFFEASGAYGRGVSAEAPKVGVQARANAADGRGVWATASGTDGRGVYGEATNTGDVTNWGGWFTAYGTTGRGVFGGSYGTSGRGVWGSTSGTSGVGVYGSATNAEGVRNYGGYFTASGTDSRGVYAAGKVYDFFAGGTGTNYGAFTGGHEVKLSEDFLGVIKPGMIVSVTGQTQLRRKEDGSPSLSSTLPTVKLASKAADKAVLGVLVAETPLPEDHWYETKEGERFATVNALGEGRVWVSNINGDVEVGDYITTSSIAGYGQRQEDDLLHSYTLGKAIEAVDWPSVQETVLMGEREIKVYLIAVTYTSG